MADGEKPRESEELSLRFKELALQRRRPSKWKTTERTFAIVRNWEANKSPPSTVRSPPEDVQDNQLDDHSSPQFPPPSSSSLPSKKQSTFSKEPSETEEERHLVVMPPTPSSVHSVVCQSTVVPGLSPSSPASSLESLQFTHQLQSVSQLTPNASPSSIIIATPTAQATTAQPDRTDTRPGHSVKANHDHQIPGPQQTRRGRKRKQASSPEEGTAAEEQYQAHRFVRLFNADQGRRVTASELTDLDVVLTAVEEIALEYREDVESNTGRQSIKEFFIQVRKAFSDSIDLHKDYNTLKSDCRKVNSKLGKLRRELLSVQQRRARIRGKLAKIEETRGKKELNEKDLLGISQFLFNIDVLEKRCSQNASQNALQRDYSAARNLPSLLCETEGLLTAATGLYRLNHSLENWLQNLGST